MAQYDKLINLGLLSQFLTKAKTIFAPKITASGILKGDGQGGVSAATAGTDYATPGLGLTGAAVGDLVRVNTVDSNGRPTSWKHVPLNEIKCNRNLLDNWYFVGGGSQLGDGVFPINQRGQTVYSGTGYGIDRWMNSSSSITTTVESDGLLVTSSINGTTWKIAQEFKSSFREQLKGKTVTFSILFKEHDTNDDIYACIYDQTGNHLGTASFSESGLVTVTYTVPSSITDFRTIVYGGTVTGFSVKIIAVKLELGSEQTLAHNEGTEENPVWVLNEIPDYGEELFKCGTSTADSADPYANKTYNKVFSAKKRIEASEDFDNYRGINAIGFYAVNGKPTNAPSSFGTLLVFQSASSAGCTQMYLAQGKIFLRQYGGNPFSWGSWKSISLS